MKSRAAFVLPVVLVALACGRSGALDSGAAGSSGTGHGGATATAGSGGATGAAGSGDAGTGGSAAGMTGTGGSAAGTTGTGGSVAGSGGAGGDGAAGRGGAAGTGAAAGMTGTGGAPGCTAGQTRCDASGRRVRCAADGSWADDNDVCTIALSGSSDYDTMCALKADGRLTCWASGEWANGQAAMMVARAPAKTWRQISVGDGPFGMCALASSGTASCWDTNGGIPPAPAGTFTAFSYSVYASCAITDAGSPTCFNTTQLPPDFTGRFKQIVTANSLVYGIDENDALHAPSFVLPSYPTAKYKQIIANNGASCAVRDDGAIFCYPVSEMLPPPAEAGFIEVATTYGNRQGCAIRADGTVTCWLGLATMQPLEAPPAGTFTHIAGCENAICGIRTDGTTACWGAPGVDPLVPPAGW